MTRILVGGYYGAGNLGDELILAAMVARLRAVRPGLAITVTSADPVATSARHGVDAVDWSDIPALIAAAAASDLVALGGGGLFHDYWGCDADALLQRHHAGVPQYLAPCLLASLLDKPLMIYAVGVGPLLTDSGRHLTRAAFELADAATVRDEPSRALLTAIGVDTSRVEVTADPAFDAGSVPGDGPRHDAGEAAPPVVAIALRSWWLGASGDAWERAVASGLDTFLDRRGGEAIFIPFQDAPEPFGDGPVAERVRALMKPGRHRSLVDSGPDERITALGASDVVLGMRLHSIVMAARAGRPVVGLAYDPKVTAMMDALGAGEQRLDLDAVTGSVVADRLDDAWRRRAVLGPAMAAAAAEQGGRARENAARLFDLLDRPRPSRAGVTPALLQRTTVQLAVAADRLNRKALEEKRALQLRADAAEAEVERWEKSKAGTVMRAWRRWRR